MRKEMCMEELAAVLQKDGLLVSVSGSARFSEVCYDSRQVKPGALFVCKGLAFKPEFLDAALRQGAVCYMAETDFGVKGIPCLIVRNVRQALSLASIYRYGRPFEAFSLVGITGTKGKTTTAYFTRSILDQAAGRPTALLSTVEMFTGGQPQEAHLTTPESLELQACFDDTRAHSIPFLTMEVSSQAYKQSRVHGVPFDVGVFLNIDEDHLGPLEHADYEDYLSCKLELLKNSRTVVPDMAAWLAEQSEGPEKISMFFARVSQREEAQRQAEAMGPVTTHRSPMRSTHGRPEISTRAATSLMPPRAPESARAAPSPPSGQAPAVSEFPVSSDPYPASGIGAVFARQTFSVPDSIAYFFRCRKRPAAQTHAGETRQIQQSIL